MSCSVWGIFSGIWSKIFFDHEVYKLCKDRTQLKNGRNQLQLPLVFMKRPFMSDFNEFLFSQYIFMKTVKQILRSSSQWEPRWYLRSDKQTWWKQWTRSATVRTSLKTAVYGALSKLHNWTISSSVPRIISYSKQLSIAHWSSWRLSEAVHTFTTRFQHLLVP
jgi:hypothetical protein